MEQLMAYHTHLTPDDVGGYVIMPGSPERVEVIARHLSKVKEGKRNRGYYFVTGFLLGQKVTAMCSLMGCTSVDFAIHDLMECYPNKRIVIIRPGTAGSLQDYVKVGHYCITTAAVRDDRVMEDYVPACYPAVADLDVTIALRQACRELGVIHHTGITHCKAVFNVENPKAKVPLRALTEQDGEGKEWKPDPRFVMWARANVLATSMEASAGCILSSINGLRFGEILQVIGNTMSNKPIDEHPSDEELVKISVHAMEIIIAQDHLGK